MINKMSLIFYFVISFLTFPYFISSDNICDCGVEGIANRIYKGSKAKANKYPWLASIRTVDEQLCGGSLVGDKHIITASHCLLDINGQVYNSSSLQIYLGRVGPSSNNDSFYTVSEIWINPKYDPLTLFGDISILTLTKSVQIDEKISPICLPNFENNLNNFTVAGWGMTSAIDPPSDDLLEVDVSLIPQNECYKMKVLHFLKRFGISDSEIEKYKLPSIAEDHLCALNGETGGDTCAGDSGGPLMYHGSNGRWYAVGIVSGSWDQCGVGIYAPGLYTRTKYHENIIKEIVPDACWRDIE